MTSKTTTKEPTMTNPTPTPVYPGDVIALFNDDAPKRVKVGTYTVERATRLWARLRNGHDVEFSLHMHAPDSASNYIAHIDTPTATGFTRKVTRVRVIKRGAPPAPDCDSCPYYATDYNYCGATDGCEQDEPAPTQEPACAECGPDCQGFCDDQPPKHPEPTPDDELPQTVRIGSAPMIYTPGVAPLANDQYQRDPINGLHIASNFNLDMPTWASWALALGAYTVDGDAIVMHRDDAIDAIEAAADKRRAEREAAQHIKEVRTYGPCEKDEECGYCDKHHPWKENPRDGRWYGDGEASYTRI